MKNILFKLIFGLFICSNCVFGQDSSKKTTANIDSVNLIKYKRNEYHGDIMRMAPIRRDSIPPYSRICGPSRASVISNTPLSVLPIENYKQHLAKVDSIKPIDTTLIHIKQQDTSTYNPNIRVCAPSRAGVMSAEPLYVLKNDNRILRDGIVNIPPLSITSIYVLKDANTTAKYGSRGANGVIVITLNEDSVFLSVEKLLSAYKVPKRYSTLPLYVNHKLIPKEQLLLQKSSVTDVKIAEELENGLKEKHIEVTTTGK